MEAIITAISPAIVSTLTSWSKRLRTIAESKHRKALLRTVVGVLSLLSVVGTSALTGESINPANVEGILQTLFVAGSTLITYYFGKSGN